MVVTEKAEMKKFILLVVLGLGLLASEFFLSEFIAFHSYYQILVLFFVVQSAILFRIEDMGGEDTKVQMRLVNIGLRMISALVFVLVMSARVNEDTFTFYVQFIVLYLVFMAFEITLALTNLRRN